MRDRSGQERKCYTLGDMSRFKDRISAARELLPKLSQFDGDLNTVVFGLPRGGVITAAEIAKGLHLPLGFLVAKKIGAPQDPELALGAVTDNGGFYIDKELKASLNVSDKYLEDEIEKKREEARTRSEEYLENFENPGIKGKTVILVDDGIATGATMVAAVRSIEKRGARRVVVAVPAGPCDNFDVIRKEADEVICLEADLELSAVGEYYDEFPQVEDSQVIEILKNAKNNINN